MSVTRRNLPVSLLCRAGRHNLGYVIRREGRPRTLSDGTRTLLTVRPAEPRAPVRAGTTNVSFGTRTSRSWRYGGAPGNYGGVDGIDGCARGTAHSVEPDRSLPITTVPVRPVPPATACLPSSQVVRRVSRRGGFPRGSHGELLDKHGSASPVSSTSAVSRRLGSPGWKRWAEVPSTTFYVRRPNPFVSSGDRRGHPRSVDPVPESFRPIQFLEPRPHSPDSRSNSVKILLN